MPKVELSRSLPAADQYQGSSPGNLDTGSLGMRAGKSASQACGSMSFIFAVTIRQLRRPADRRVGNVGEDVGELGRGLIILN